jgi:UDP-N-acetylglucosamine 2-epimerase
MDGFDFLKVSNNTLCLIGNSSVGIRECSYLGVPVVNIGSRQNRRERGPNVIDASYDALSILMAIENQLRKGKYPNSQIYGDGNSGKRIADILSKCNPKTNKTISY